MRQIRILTGRCWMVAFLELFDLNMLVGWYIMSDQSMLDCLKRFWQPNAQTLHTPLYHLLGAAISHCVIDRWTRLRGW